MLCDTTLAQVFVRVISSMCPAPEWLSVPLRSSLCSLLRLSLNLPLLLPWTLTSTFSSSMWMSSEQDPLCTSSNEESCPLANNTPLTKSVNIWHWSTNRTTKPNERLKTKVPQNWWNIWRVLASHVPGRLGPGNIHEFLHVRHSAPRQRRWRFWNASSTVWKCRRFRRSSKRCKHWSATSNSVMVFFPNTWTGQMVIQHHNCPSMQRKIVCIQWFGSVCWWKCTDHLDAARIWENDRIKDSVESPKDRPYYDTTGKPTEFVEDLRERNDNPNPRTHNEKSWRRWLCTTIWFGGNPTQLKLLRWQSKTCRQVRWKLQTRTMVISVLEMKKNGTAACTTNQMDKGNRQWRVWCKCSGALLHCQEACSNVRGEGKVSVHYNGELNSAEMLMM